MKNLLFLLSFIYLTSCSNDDENIDVASQNPIESYRFYYMDYPETMNSPNNITVVYNEGKIVKLNGGLSELASESGFLFAFNDNRFTEISYAANTVTVIEKDLFYQNFASKQIIALTTEGKLKSKISIDPFDPNIKDTIEYFYQNGVLKSFEKHNRRLISKSEIFYNAQADVDSIVTRAPNYITPSQPYFDPLSKERSVRKFQNFDNNDNPFKAFVIFDEAFNRSLSAHNYNKWEQVTYDYDGHIIVNFYKEWSYVRENGIINFAL